VSLVLGCKINTPVNLVFELDLALFDFLLKDLNTLCVGNSPERGVNDLL